VVLLYLDELYSSPASLGLQLLEALLVGAGHLDSQVSEQVPDASDQGPGVTLRHELGQVASDHRVEVELTITVEPGPTDVALSL